MFLMEDAVCESMNMEDMTLARDDSCWLSLRARAASRFSPGSTPLFSRSKGVFPGRVTQRLASQQGRWGNVRYKMTAGSCGGRMAGGGEETGQGRALVERGLVFIIPGATTCQPGHLVLDMIVDSLLGGNRNCKCREILPHVQVGSENFTCPNAVQPVLSHKA